MRHNFYTQKCVELKTKIPQCSIIASPSPNHCTSNVYFKKLRRKKSPLLHEPILCVGIATMVQVFGSYTLYAETKQRNSAWEKKARFFMTKQVEKVQPWSHWTANSCHKVWSLTVWVMCPVCNRVSYLLDSSWWLTTMLPCVKMWWSVATLGHVCDSISTTTMWQNWTLTGREMFFYNRCRETSWQQEGGGEMRRKRNIQALLQLHFSRSWWELWRFSSRCIHRYREQGCGK